MREWIVIAEGDEDFIEADGPYTPDEAEARATEQFRREEIHRVVVTRLNPPVEE